MFLIAEFLYILLYGSFKAGGGGGGGGGEEGEREEERRILRDDVVLRGNSRGIGRLNRV